MTYKENITAILECYFTGFKEEIIDSACNRILEQYPCEEDTIGRQASIDFINNHLPFRASNEVYDAYADCVRMLGDNKALPSVNLQLCEDTISRQAVLNALYALCDTGETLKENPWRDNPHIDAVVKTIEELPSVNPQSCEDAISRQAVRHILNHEVKMPIKVWKKVFELVDDLPPVTPQPKTGHWIQENSVLICSICDARVARYDKYPYCPNCGAKMLDPQGEDAE